MRKLKFNNKLKVFGGEFLEEGKIYEVRKDKEINIYFLKIKNELELALYDYELKAFEVVE